MVTERSVALDRTGADWLTRLPCSSSPVFFFLCRVSWCLVFSLLLVLDVWAAAEPNRLPDYDINDPKMKVPTKFCSVTKEGADANSPQADKGLDLGI